MIRSREANGTSIITADVSRKKKYERKESLSSYINKKVRILKHFGIIAPKDIFTGCKNEIQVDNRAHSLYATRY